MPSTMTYRILRSWTSRRSSLVGSLSRRAASEARSKSPEIASLELIEAQFTVEARDLMLELGEDGEVIAVNKSISSILQRSKQL
jgi:hypothetical protein